MHTPKYRLFQVKCKLKALWDGKVAVDVSLESVWDRIKVFKII